MYKLPPITNDYESELLDTYTEYYFILKERSDINNISYYYKNRNKYRYPYKCNCERRYPYRCTCISPDERYYNDINIQLKHISQVCFNKRESIIPFYYINRIINTKEYQRVLKKHYSFMVRSTIEDCIDCYLMDCKNIASIIFSYSNKHLLYNYYCNNKVYYIITHEIDCLKLLNWYIPYSLINNDNVKNNSKKIYTWEQIEPPIVQIEELIKIPDYKTNFTIDDSKIESKIIDINNKYKNIYNKIIVEKHSHTLTFERKMSLKQKCGMLEMYNWCSVKGNLYSSKSLAVYSLTNIYSHSIPATLLN
jgi:hypothetical protein